MFVGVADELSNLTVEDDAEGLYGRVSCIADNMSSYSGL